MRLYAIQATVCPAGKDGWKSGGVQIPMFYLNPLVQGIVDARHAEEIALDMFRPLLREEGDVISVSAMAVDIDPSE